jgi:hypothetical protein
VICEAKRIWGHYFLLYVRKAFRALHPGPVKWPGFSLHYRLMRLCGFAEQIALPSLNTRPRPDHHDSGTGRRHKAQGVDATNILKEFRVSGTIERSFLIPNPRPLIPASFMVRPRLGGALPNRPARFRSPVHTCTWWAPVEVCFRILTSLCQHPGSLAHKVRHGQSLGAGLLRLRVWHHACTEIGRSRSPSLPPPAPAHGIFDRGGGGQYRGEWVPSPSPGESPIHLPWSCPQTERWHGRARVRTCRVTDARHQKH